MGGKLAFVCPVSTTLEVEVLTTGAPESEVNAFCESQAIGASSSFGPDDYLVSQAMMDARIPDHLLVFFRLQQKLFRDASPSLHDQTSTGAYPDE
jgi:hypothetical protein